MTIRGMVGEITDVRIRGWALDSEAPDSKLEIALMEDDAILSKTTNGLFREDLAQKGLSETHGGFEISVPENCFGKDLKVVVLGHDHVLPRINNKKSTCLLLARQRTGTNGLRGCLNGAPKIRAYNELFDPAARYKSHFNGNFAHLVSQTISDLGGVFFEFHRVMLNTYGAETVSTADSFERLLAGVSFFSSAQHVLFDVKYNSMLNVAPFWSEFDRTPEIVRISKERGFHVLNLTRQNYLSLYLSGCMAQKTGLYVVDGRDKKLSVGSTQVEMETHNLLNILSTYKAQDAYIRSLFSDYPRFMHYDYEDVFSGDRVSDEFLSDYAEFISLEEAIPPVTTTKKLIKRSMSEVIRNYAEVEKFLMGTEFEYCLK